MVFVLLFLPVVLLSLIFLYKAGRITSEKMELQNAADAAAYSVSVIEARDLNYMAYTNRAMVANEVAIGQLVGLASWARHWRSFADYIRAYDRLVLAPFTFGASTPIVNGFTSAIFIVPGQPASTLLGNVAKIGAQVLSMINKVFGGSQTGFHIISVLYAVSTLEDIVDRNAPGAEISPFSLLSLVAHAYTWGAIPGSDGSFIKTYKPASTQPGDIEGMQRFAATVRQSRDEFTTKRGWEFELPLIDIDESWCFPPCGSDFSEGATLDEEQTDDEGNASTVSTDTDAFFYFYLDLRVYFSFELRRLGGSELRYVGDTASGNKFNWSAADTTDVGVNFEFDMLFGVHIDLGIFGEYDFDVGDVDVSFGGGKVQMALCFSIPIPPFPEICVEVPEFDFPTTLPFSGGAYQAGPAGAQWTLAKNLIADQAPLYGDAPSNFIAWRTGIPPDVAGIASLGPIPGHMYQALNKSSTYKGLPRYSDVQLNDDPWGYEAPYFLIGLVKDYTRGDGTGIADGDPVRPTGRLDVQYGDETDEIAALAKSEVYFARPNDLDYFQRIDGYQEYGNAFNPYWQARLAPVTYADEIVSLWLQQGEQFSSLADVLNLPTWLPTDLLP